MIKRLFILVLTIGLVVAACGVSPGELVSKTVEMAQPSGGVIAASMPNVDIFAIPTQAYTVQPGDTLSGIAVAYGTDVETVLALNVSDYPVLAENPRALQVGWTLLVPEVSYAAVAPTLGPSANAPVAEISSDDASSAPGAVSAPAASSGLTVEAVEQTIIEQINAERAAAGLNTLVRDETLMRLARARSEDMAARGYLAHKDPVTGANLIPCPCAENIMNIGYGGLSRAASATVPGWMNSAGHRENILRLSLVTIGVGVAPAGSHAIVTALLAEN